MNQLVLSGTATLVLSGTRSSCYRGPKSGLSGCFFTLYRHRNFTNQKSFGFLLTSQTTSILGDGQQRDVNPASGRKPHTRFTDPKAHASHVELLGAAA
ncbi:hypothetical protein ACVWYH_009796 [Bradyrhizobium sp. GM24.11]